MTPQTEVCSFEDLARRSLSKTLGAAEEEVLAAHLDVCPTCRSLAGSGSQLAALQDDVRWAEQTRERVQLDVNVPLARLNERLADYEVLEEIGRGGMGIVYKARQVGLDRIVALKVLPALLGAVRPDAMARFRREATLAASLEHTNIIGVHDFGEVDGMLYYAMRLVEGRSLRDLLAEIEQTECTAGLATSAADDGARAIPILPGSCEIPISHAVERESPPANAERASDSQAGADPRDAIPVDTGASTDYRTSTSAKRDSRTGTDRAHYQQIARWVAEVAEALQYAHDRGIIHRDIKPSNLLLARDGQLMISDFGLARYEQGNTITATHSLLGTARYMSPEQLADPPQQVDGRADIYGLGATLYELLAFRPMFAGTDDREVVHRVLNDEPTPPRRHVRQVPRELEAICLKAVEKDRAKRYRSAQALADDLRRWLLGIPVLAHRPSWPRRAAKFARRRKLPVGLALLAAAALISAAVVGLAYSKTRRAAVQAQVTADRHQFELLFKQAEAARDQGDLPAALKKIENALALQPRSLDARCARARMTRLMFREREAFEELQAILKEDPEYWPAHDEMSLIYAPLVRNTGGVYVNPGSPLRGMSPEEIRARFEHHRREYVRHMPETAQAYYLLASTAEDHRTALTLLDTALALDPTHLPAINERCERHARLGDHEASLRDAERFIARAPHLWLGHTLLGNALRRLGRYDQALSSFDRAVKLDSTQTLVWFCRAQVLCLLERFEEALADSAEAIRLDPESVVGYAVRARALDGLRDFEASLMSYQRALEIGPDRFELWNNRASVLKRLQRWNDLIENAEKIIALDAKQARGYADRGSARFHLGELDAAVRDWDTAVEHASLNREVYLGRGMVHEIAGRYQAALADYTEAAMISGPDRKRALLWRYVLLRHRGEDAAAGELLRNFLPDPQSTAPYDRLADYFRGERSAEELTGAAAAATERARAYYFIGRWRLLSGDRDGALDAFRACIHAGLGDVLEADLALALTRSFDRTDTPQSSGLNPEPVSTDRP